MLPGVLTRSFIKNKRVFYLLLWFLPNFALQTSSIMFSKTCEYAIRAMIFIAHKSKGGERVGIKDIAKGIEAPEHFIAKILQDLSRKNLVLSIKGPNGGFYHDQESAQSSLADIVKTVDGDKIFHGCGLGLKECSEVHPCPIHHEFKKVRQGVQRMLEKASIESLTEGLKSELAFLRK